MYADVAASTGWTWEYIGQCLTLPRLEAMNDHWRQFPPVHKSVAGFLGIKSSPKMPAANEADAETAAYVNSMPVLNVRLPS